MLIEDVLTEFKRTHLEHIEDIIITDGYVGGQAVVEYFRGLLLTLKGTSSEAMSVSVKWDGAPAVVCGTNPDNGQFFVGTKAVFAKAAKINYTKKDIAKNHGTTYTGDSLATMNAQGGADVSSFAQSPDVFFDNASYKDVSGSAKFTADESQQFYNSIDKLETLLNSVPRDLSSVLGQNTDFVPMFQMYINAMVKQGELPSNVNQFLLGFKKFYADRMQQQISGLKAQKALQLRQDKMKQMPVFLSKAKKPLQAMLTFYKAVQQMKGFVLKKMNQAMAIGSFSQTDNGLQVTEPEGFVAVDKSGNAVKLVDRLGFSRRNLTAISKFKK
jgi:hypothetical protein